MTDVYATDLPDVMHEIIDGEAVIANVETGCYYGIEGSGAVLWELLAAGGHSADTLVDAVLARYGGARAEVAAAVQRFLDELRAEELVRVVDGGASPNDPGPGARAGVTTEAFTEPTITKYTDMQTLLLADPIHEVDDEGWPNLK